MDGNGGEQGLDAPVDRQVEEVERAMVAIRRSQSRRALARLAERRGGRPAGPAARPVGGSVVDVLDVVEAAEQAGRPATVAAVAAALAVDQPRASRLVAAAVQADLLRREADQADGRRALLVRTDAGRAVSEQVHQFRRAVFAAAMADWSDRDRVAFARLLTRFVRSLASLTEPDAPD